MKNLRSEAPRAGGRREVCELSGRGADAMIVLKRGTDGYVMGDGRAMPARQRRALPDLPDLREPHLGIGSGGIRFRDVKHYHRRRLRYACCAGFPRPRQGFPLPDVAASCRPSHMYWHQLRGRGAGNRWHNWPRCRLRIVLTYPLGGLSAMDNAESDFSSAEAQGIVDTLNAVAGGCRNSPELRRVMRRGLQAVARGDLT